MLLFPYARICSSGVSKECTPFAKLRLFRILHFFNSLNKNGILRVFVKMLFKQAAIYSVGE